VDPTQPEIDFSEVCVYQWGSALEYQAAIKRWPQIREQLHACGPGRTHSEMLKILGGDERLYINWA
jgi:hydroxymethylbilane synthase